MKKFFTLIAAALVAGSAFAQGEGFVNVIKNGDLSANNMTNFKSNDYWDDGTRHPESGNPVDARVLSDKGELCIIVQSNNNPSQEWDAQFFVTVPEDEAFEAGTLLQLKMKVKADRAQTCGGQVHSAPGTYVQNLQFNVPSIKFTTGWDNYDSGVMTVKGDGTRTLAFNLADKNGTKLANTFYFDDIELWVKRPKPIVWIPQLVNGECEGNNASPYSYKIKKQYYKATIVDGAGKDGSRAVVVTSDATPANDWDTQFFITVDHKFAANEKFTIKFDAKADKEAKAQFQAHKACAATMPAEGLTEASKVTDPETQHIGTYIGGCGISDATIPTEWKTFELKGTAAADMQSVCLNLSCLRESIKYYFDNIVICIDEDKASDEEKELAEKIADGYTGDEEVATAINSAKVAKTAKAIYNVAGQQMKNLQKGLNIVEGKKIYVK